ncbi:conserved Plasmodium protein, unknown function [Plasmodium ovale curtisi]|uniref:SUEL-type lectin domain-containing protein n=1 Tax=Plasmodium ovale curtisi TaxID=864141 RepID=A0A1A8WV29_PLAOA|nr:conserved Plasmodium protein, unknown function [Plasmodium ovale curtisi]
MVRPNVVQAGEVLPSQETDSPIFYYGFINNERYQHYMPSKSPNIQRDVKIKARDLITISCNKGYTVAVKKASIRDLNEEENDYTKMAQEMCSKKEQCKIDVRKFKRNTENNQIDITSDLMVEYICMSSQKNLYDGNTFHQGALETCTRDNCKYVVWNDEERRAIICHGWNSNDLVEKKNNITYINPILFYTHGYATFLNYMSICDHVIKSAPHNLSMAKSVDVCSHLDCDYFTKSYEGSIRSLNNHRNGKSW